jgi:hypothetical protein
MLIHGSTSHVKGSNFTFLCPFASPEEHHDGTILLQYG